jgi:hypothetical protein
LQILKSDYRNNVPGFGRYDPTRSWNKHVCLFIATRQLVKSRVNCITWQTHCLARPHAMRSSIYDLLFEAKWLLYRISMCIGILENLHFASRTCFVYCETEERLFPQVILTGWSLQWKRIVFSVS